MRILFTQRGSGGGSATGLLDLIRALEGAVEPVVMLYKASRFHGEFEDVGAIVIVLEDEEGSAPRSGNRGSGRLHSMSRRFGRAGALFRLARTELPVARRIARHVQKIRPDVVHHNIHPTTDRPAILGALMAGVPQVSHVRWIRDTVPFVDPIVARSVDHFVYMSEAIRKDLEPRLHLSRRRGSVIYDPFDLGSWSPELDGGGGRNRMRAELGVPEDAVVLMNVGRLVPWKGQDVFIRAVGLLNGDPSDVHAILIGDAGSDEEDEFVARLESLRAELGLEERVHFLGFRRDIPDLMEASDVIVHSSTTPEPFGRVVVEGMAAGRPVVATSAGGPLEIVDDGRTGLLVTPGDAEAMAGALRTLIRNPSNARAMGNEGRAVARDRFGPERFAEEMTRIYHEVAPSRSR